MNAKAVTIKVAKQHCLGSIEFDADGMDNLNLRIIGGPLRVK